MKKLVAALLPLAVILCGCARSSSGNAAELTGRCWSAELEGGGEARLSFDGGLAVLSMKNGDESVVIGGEYLADGSELVIFDASAGQNYRFEYVPRGETLDLSYNGHTVEMNAV